MSAYDLIVVGASWGGFEAVGDLLSALPAGFAPALVVVQHRGPDSNHGTLERVWGRRSRLPVVEIDDKDPISPGRVHVAPADYHLLIEAGHFELSVDEVVQYSRPSIDVTFETAAGTYGERLVAVLLTGANEDGGRGLARARERGAHTIAQEPGSAEKATMPQAGIDTGGAVEVLPLARIGPRLVELCSGDRSAA